MKESKLKSWLAAESALTNRYVPMWLQIALGTILILAALWAVWTAL